MLLYSSTRHCRSRCFPLCCQELACLRARAQAFKAPALSCTTAWISFRAEIKLGGRGGSKPRFFFLFFYCSMRAGCHSRTQLLELKMRSAGKIRGSAKWQENAHVRLLYSEVWTSACVCVCVRAYVFANDCCLRRSARLEVRERGGFARIWGGFAAGALASGLSHSSFTVALQADECHSVPKACCTLV